MGLLSGPLKVDQSEVDVVYSEDPDVKVPDELRGCGWIPADRCQVNKGADKIRIRILRPGEERERADLQTEQGLHFALSRACLAHNGTKKASAIMAFLDALYVSNGGISANNRPGATAWRLLAYRVLAATNGKSLDDYHAAARAMLGYELEEVADDDGASKSDAG